MATGPEPFRVRIEQAVLDDLRRRRQHTRWPAGATSPQWSSPIRSLATSGSSSGRCSRKHEEGTMKKAILGGLLGGLTLFVWGSISHMALPLGEAGVRAIPPAAEGAVLAALKGALSERALYVFPGLDMTHASAQERQAWLAGLVLARVCRDRA